MRRRQFPLQKTFATAVNKFRGQTSDKIGIQLNEANGGVQLWPVVWLMFMSLPPV